MIEKNILCFVVKIMGENGVAINMVHPVLKLIKKAQVTSATIAYMVQDIEKILKSMYKS